jgi:cysteinyl-tRNA synthetase
MTDDASLDGGGEDKMEVAAQRMREAKKQGRAPVENPDDPYQIADYFTRAFIEDARKLRLKIADEHPRRVPHATAHVPQMIAMIQRLIERGHAYVVEGRNGLKAVYYSVESFPDYGRLSGNTIDKLRGGAGGRVSAENQAAKRHPADFLLWKNDPTHVMKWDSPWGVGYPGWHIECSAMSTHLLGRDVIDIHTGGEDNIFPHHECEIAQTCGATGNDRFARYWMHTRFLLVEGEKMSKSKGNFFTVRDVIGGKVTGREVDPAVLRFELIKAHYRKNADFTRKGLEDSASAVRKLRDAAAALSGEAGGETAPVDHDHPALQGFIEALADDLNVAGALAEAFEFIAGDHKQPAESLAVLREMDRVLAVLNGEAATPGAAALDDETARKVAAIDAARRAKDFATADRIRQELIDAGYEVKTTKDGTMATKKLA